MSVMCNRDVCNGSAPLPSSHAHAHVHCGVFHSRIYRAHVQRDRAETTGFPKGGRRGYILSLNGMGRIRVGDAGGTRDAERGGNRDDEKGNVNSISSVYVFIRIQIVYSVHLQVL